MAKDKPTTAIIVKGYPRISETFITQELEALEKCGLNFIIYSLRKPHDTIQHSIHKNIKAQCVYLPEYIYQQPKRTLKAFAKIATKITFYKSLMSWLTDFIKNPTPNQARRFAQATIIASEMPASIQHIYFHFIHTPATVALYTATMRNIKYSGSAHAKDIWTSNPNELKKKIQHAQWIATCTNNAAQYLQSLNHNQKYKIKLIYHGLNQAQFPQQIINKPNNKTITIASVGRLVPKKGYDKLLQALSKIPPHLKWQFIHIGEGQLKQNLKNQAKNLNIHNNITWLGAQERSKVIEILQQAHIFALANIITQNGDRDGIPNVIAEAMWMQNAVIAGNLPSIQELVKHQKNGLLCDGSDENAIAENLSLLIENSKLRKQLAAEGRKTIEKQFLFSHNFIALKALFDDNLFTHA